MPHSPPLTLRRIMAVIAALALAFAFLPILLSAALAVTVVGILVLEGLRLPLITDGGGVRRWLPWVLWSLALATCPIATAVVGTLYEHTGPPAFSGPRPWDARVVDGLAFAHLSVRRLSCGSRADAGWLPLVGLGSNPSDWCVRHPSSARRCDGNDGYLLIAGANHSDVKDTRSNAVRSGCHVLGGVRGGQSGSSRMPRFRRDSRRTLSKSKFEII
jgi:hypothetical protein